MKRIKMNTNSRGEVVTLTLLGPVAALLPDTDGEGPDPSGDTHTLSAGRYKVTAATAEGWMVLDGGGVNWIVPKDKGGNV